MTTFYSDHFTDEAPNGTILGVKAKPRVIAGPGVGSALKLKWVLIDFADATIATNDYVRLFSLRSGDRLRRITLSVDESGSSGKPWAATTLAVRAGLWEAGANHDGPVIDDNMFRTNNALNLLSDPVEEVVLWRLDDTTERLATARMQPLWQIVHDQHGGITHTEDPKEDWDVVLKFSSVLNITTGGAILVQCEYVPGGAG